MRRLLIPAFVLASSLANAAAAEPDHSHPPPEKLGTVHFEASCAPTVRAQFDRAVALLHSFAYDPAGKAFSEIASQDPGCAIAHWGVAMSAFHQLWNPPGPAELQLGQDQLQEAHRIGAHTARERELIDAAAVYFSDTDPTHHAQRVREESSLDKESRPRGRTRRLHPSHRTHCTCRRTSSLAWASGTTR